MDMGTRWRLAKRRKKQRRMEATSRAPRLEMVTEQQTVMALLDIIEWALRKLREVLGGERRLGG